MAEKKIMKRSVEQAKDGYLGDLTEELQKIVADVHKIIKDTAYELFETMSNDPKYIRLKNELCHSMLDEFLVMPTDKNQVGSVRLYKNGTHYSCMIQATGHVFNQCNNPSEREFHDFIKCLYKKCKEHIRKTCDVHLSCESDSEMFEGFDIWTKSDVAKELWDKFDHNTIKTIKEEDYKKESTDNEVIHNALYIECDELPSRLQDEIYECRNDLIYHMCEAYEELNIEDVELDYFIDKMLEYASLNINSGTTFLERHDERYNGRIEILPELVFENKEFSSICEKAYLACAESYNDGNKHLAFNKDNNYFEFVLDPNYASGLYTFVEFTIPDHTKQALKRMVSKQLAQAKEGKVDDAASKPLTKEEFKSECNKNLKDFKKRYKYNDKDKTCVINGKKYYCDADIHNPYIIINYQGRKIKQPRATAVTANNMSRYPTLFLDADQFQDSQYKYIDSVIQHEAGHIINGDMGIRHRGKNPRLMLNKFLTKTLMKKYYDPASSHLSTKEFAADLYSRGKTKDDGIYHLLTQAYIDETVANVEKDVKRYDKMTDEEINKEFDKIFKDDMQAIRYLLTYARIRYIEDGNKKRSENPVKFLMYLMKNFNKLLGEMVRYDPRRLFKFMERSIASQCLVDRNARHRVLLDSSLKKYNPFQEAVEIKESKVLNTLLQTASKRGKLTPDNLNTISKIISKEYLSLWTKEFESVKLNVTKSDKKNSIVTFKTPKFNSKMLGDLNSRNFNMEKFLRSNKEIDITMSDNIYFSFKNEKEFISFIQRLVTFYARDVNSKGDKLIQDLMNLKLDAKNLLTSTNLSSTFTLLMHQFFKFEKVNIEDPKFFINATDKFVKSSDVLKSIIKAKNSSKETKDEVYNKIKNNVKSIKETYELDNDELLELSKFEEAVKQYLDGNYDKLLNELHERWEIEQIDFTESSDYEAQYIKEWFGVKKLKKIPRDLVAYISIETESIKDANDKMMIASYCLGKLEIVEWYLELLAAGSKKYVVPHSKPELEHIRTQLLACYKKIMDTKIVRPEDVPIISVKYPKRYEG